MALQPKIIDCGARLTAFAMLLRFVAAPATMGIASLMVGLRGDVLCISILQVYICLYFYTYLIFNTQLQHRETLGC